MLGIREVADLGRAILIAYRSDSYEGLRLLGEDCETIFQISDMSYVAHPQTFLETLKRLRVEHLALSAAQERQEPRKEYTVSRKGQSQDVVCLAVEGPQTFTSLEPAPWSYLELFGKSDLRDCFIAWECSLADGTEPEREVDGETILLTGTEGRGAFFACELTYDRHGWVKGCVMYLVLISFALVEDRILHQQKLVYTLRQKKTHAKNPFAREALKPGTLPLDQRWQDVIQRAQDGYQRCCAPYPREKEELFREFVLQETLAKRDKDTSPAWSVVRGLPIRDKVEYLRQLVVNRSRLSDGASKSYRERIRNIDVFEALATVWEPWQLLAFVQEKLCMDKPYSSAVEELLRCRDCSTQRRFHAWKHAWSPIRANRILSFGSFVEAHLPDDWK